MVQERVAETREHVPSFDDGYCCCYVGTGGHCPTCHKKMEGAPLQFNGTGEVDEQEEEV